MKTNKSKKIFNLVVSPSDCSLKKRAIPITFYKEAPNLFQQELPEHMNVIRVQQYRTFDFVGVKELKDYYERIRRTSKQRRRETFSHNFNQSRTSVNSKDRDMLSKQQVLQKIEDRSAHNSNNITRIRSQNVSLLSEELNESLNTTNNSKVIDCKQNHNLSLHKVKLNHKSYAELWERTQKRSGQMKGFPSVIKTVNEQRQKSLFRQKNESNFLSQNINSRMWAVVLRDKRQLKNIYDRHINKQSKICKKSLKVMGKSKIKQEKEWLGRKENLGYYFKFCKDQTHA